MDQHDLTTLAAQAKRAVGRQAVERPVYPLLRNMKRGVDRMADRKPRVDDACHAPPAPALQRNGHRDGQRSEEHTTELQSIMRISYAVFCLNKTKILVKHHAIHNTH